MRSQRRARSSWTSKRTLAALLLVRAGCGSFGGDRPHPTPDDLERPAAELDLSGIERNGANTDVIADYWSSSFSRLATRARSACSRASTTFSRTATPWRPIPRSRGFAGSAASVAIWTHSRNSGARHPSESLRRHGVPVSRGSSRAKLMTRPDALTGLLDREAFDSDLGAAVADASSANRPLSLVFVDIDRFKQVNDTEGHQKGDAVLKEVAARLMSVVEKKGSAYRYGGEEVALILPNHTAEEATSVAERARRALEGDAVAGLPITASFGVATVPYHASDGDTLIRAADAAMYDAKNRGRNLVRVFGEPDPPKGVSREPVRKAPEPGRLTEIQMEAIRTNYFQRRVVVCPDDGTPLDVRRVDLVGSPIPDLLVHCPLCGLHARISKSR
jgi:diguanylate cyclase (GGDEF)-like protein